MLGVGFECFSRMMHHGGKDAERAYSSLRFVAVP